MAVVLSIAGHGAQEPERVKGSEPDGMENVFLLAGFQPTPAGSQERILGKMLGYYTRDVGELNQLIYLWPFDSMEERSRRRDALLADPDFKVFRGRIRHLLVKQENSLLVPAGPRQPVEIPQ